MLHRVTAPKSAHVQILKYSSSYSTIPYLIIIFRSVSRDTALTDRPSGVCVPVKDGPMRIEYPGHVTPSANQRAPSSQQPMKSSRVIVT